MTYPTPIMSLFFSYPFLLHIDSAVLYYKYSLTNTFNNFASCTVLAKPQSWFNPTVHLLYTHALAADCYKEKSCWRICCGLKSMVSSCPWSSILPAVLLWFSLPASFLILPRIQLKTSVLSLNLLLLQLCPHHPQQTLHSASLRKQKPQETPFHQRIWKLTVLLISPSSLAQ